MTLLVIIGLLALIGLWLTLFNREPRWLKHGKLTRRGYKSVNDHDYYFEEVKFEGYQKALSQYYKVVSEVEAQAQPLEVKYDLYDWTYSIVRFPTTTIELRHIRPLQIIRLVRSLKPLSIEEMEADNPTFN